MLKSELSKVMIKVRFAISDIALGKYADCMHDSYDIDIESDEANLIVEAGETIKNLRKYAIKKNRRLKETFAKSREINNTTKTVRS